jgi:DNA-binding NtrC family response regulator
MDKVLLFDEDDQLRDRIEVELKKYEGQYRLVVAASLEKAEAMIRRKEITLFVVGIDLKNAQNRDFLTRVSIRYPQVPFILIHEGSRPAVEDADRFNTLAVIHKPFEWNALAGAVIEGLDFIDEGLLWRRQCRNKGGSRPVLAEQNRDVT